MTFTGETMRRAPCHPGGVLRDELNAMDMTVKDAAQALGVSRQMLHRILAEKAPVTAEMALRIGKLLGNGPRLWLRMQAAYDLWHAEQELADDLERIPTHKAA